MTLSQPSALGLLMNAFRSDRQILALNDVVPPGVSAGEMDTFQRQVFVDSQQAAAAPAARAAGYDATVTGGGAQVLGILPSSPATKVLNVNDVITAVDNMPVRTAGDLHGAVAGHPPGQPFTVTVDRAGQILTRQVSTARLPRISGGPGIGVVVQTKDPKVVLPFNITFRPRPDIGGPSAGLAYALAITDMLDNTDDASSRAVAATGTVATDGSVGPVGGVHEKAIAARDAGAQLFIVPADEVSSVQNKQLTVRGVEDVTGAVGFLRS